MTLADLLLEWKRLSLETQVSEESSTAFANLECLVLDALKAGPVVIDQTVFYVNDDLELGEHVEAKRLQDSCVSYQDPRLEWPEIEAAAAQWLKEHPPGTKVRALYGMVTIEGEVVEIMRSSASCKQGREILVSVQASGDRCGAFVVPLSTVQVL